MKLLFVLNQDHLPLAQEELAGILGRQPLRTDHFLAIASTDNPICAKHLALTHECLSLLTSFPIVEHKTVVSQFVDHCAPIISKTIGTASFAFRFESHSQHKSHGVTEQQIGKQIYTILQETGKKPTVDLTQPEVLLKGIVIGNRFYLGHFLYATNDSWQERRAHLRPAKKPISLSPRLAKALINCLGAKNDELICDPFCGTGGFLIEAGLLGKKIVGSDIDSEMIEATKQNCDAFSIRPQQISVKDAFSYTDPFSYLITDLPYFKNTKQQNTVTFYADVLTHFLPLVKKKMILCVPDRNDILTQIENSLATYTKKYIRNDFVIYLHASLQKRIICITK